MRPGGPPHSAYLRVRYSAQVGSHPARSLRSRSYLITEQIEAVKSLKLQSAVTAVAASRTSRHGVIISGRLLSLPLPPHKQPEPISQTPKFTLFSVLLL